MFFQKRRGNNKYLIFATYQGYDLTKQPDQQLEKYDAWKKSDYDFYDEVIKYYEDSNEAKCYKKGQECDSESDEEWRKGGVKYKLSNVVHTYHHLLVLE